ncbi:CaiB/BaiF CoA transferase family protein [Chelatococcus reniformis]|uniref:CoA transferase n=1 Tax=Chelatococcus reniformis TaxID=1494448 RepID=A0A916XKT6_9HYPH|nr:CaiB/BaiF CoA-transferase family protein [Chelatococcus reniformis]GGC79053.1 CoA transferase [Chelatococcus reniformis]
MTTPLKGVRVLELARVLAGPWAGQLLADLGADVVKVERAGVGDDTRQWGPPFVRGADGANLSAAYYHSTNRGKRSIEVDFESEQGRALVRRLAAHADVVIENFKVGGLAKYGLDYAGLSAINPRLIYCSVTGFGQDGPYASRPGYDFMIQGLGGIMSLTGEPEGEPVKTGVAFADIFTGMYASVAILAALQGRTATGAGCHIDMALLDTQVAVLGNQALNYFVAGEPPPRMGNAHSNVVPYQVVPAADGHIIIASGTDGQYVKICEVLGVPELAHDPRFAKNADRLANRGELMALLTARTATFTKDDLLAKLVAVGVPVGPINRLDEVFAHPQVVYRGLRVELPAADAAGGSIPTLRSPIVIDGEPVFAPTPSPALGADTNDVLRDPAWGGAGPAAAAGG